MIKFYFDEGDLTKSRKVLDLFKKIITDFILMKLPKKNEEGLKV